MYSGYVRKRVYCKPVYVSGTLIQCDTNTGLEVLEGETVADVVVSFTIFVIKFTRRIVLPGDPVQFRPPFALAFLNQSVNERLTGPRPAFGSINKQIFQVADGRG